MIVSQSGVDGWARDYYLVAAQAIHFRSLSSRHLLQNSEMRAADDLQLSFLSSDTIYKLTCKLGAAKYVPQTKYTELLDLSGLTSLPHIRKLFFTHFEV